MSQVGIQIAGEFLDLSPNTFLELEEENPYLQLGTQIQGQYSLPFSVPATEKNMRLLGYPNILNIRKTTVGIEALLFCEGIQHSRGQVKLETGSSNINQPQRGIINLYYLFGISDFFKLLENKMLQDVNYGDDIVYPWTGQFYFDDGFWAYLTYTMINGNPDNSNFAFFPIFNEPQFADNPDISQILLNNFVHVPDNLSAPDIVPFTPTSFCPFVYLKFILNKAFELIGWKLQGDILNDPEFKKIVVLYNNSIDWTFSTFVTHEVRWNLRDYVPKIKISTFLINLQNRLGWWYEFDFRKKVCTIKSRQTIFQSRVKKDFTDKSAANYSFKINSLAKIYSLNQTGGEQAPDNIIIINEGILDNYFQLPAVSTDLLNHQYFIKSENAYYICLMDDDNNPVWEKQYDNTVDFVPADSNEKIETGCLVPDTAFRRIRKYEDNTESDRYMVVPSINLDPAMGETETFYICYHHGILNSVNNLSLPEWRYPAGSAGCYDLHGNLICQKALVYQFKGNDNIPRGLYENNWKYFLSLIAQAEEITIPVSFNMSDLLNLRYNDTLIIRNSEYFIKNPHLSLPLKDFSSMELVRL